MARVVFILCISVIAVLLLYGVIAPVKKGINYISAILLLVLLGILYLCAFATSIISLL